jgi:cell division protein FtsB
MAAASTTRRPPAAGIRWDRISRYGLLIVFVLLLFLYVNPLRSYIHTLQESKERASQVSALEAEHHRLEARKRGLGDPSVVESEARRLGMVRPGERPFVVRGLPNGQ